MTKQIVYMRGAPSKTSPWLWVGQLITIDGKILGRHCSSSAGWLRQDLLAKLPKEHNYEIVDEIRG